MTVLFFDYFLQLVSFFFNVNMLRKKPMSETRNLLTDFSMHPMHSVSLSHAARNKHVTKKPESMIVDLSCAYIVGAIFCTQFYRRAIF